MTFESLLSAETRRLQFEEPFELECGSVLPRTEVSYRTWGEPRSEAILVCHALTGSADADDWWKGLFGEGRALDPSVDYIVASNVLGGCYGTTGPGSPMLGEHRHYASEFPRVTIRDMVRFQARLLDALGIERVQLAIGGSMGGMQVLEWPLLYPERVQAIVPVCVSARHSAWCVGISEAQRQAIRADQDFDDGHYPLGAGPTTGLASARMMALISYRSRESFAQRFDRVRHDGQEFEVERYLRYQGEKLAMRFDANTYIRLTEAMDSHDVGRDRGDYREVLAAIKQPALVIGVTSDVLYPLIEQEELARHLSDARLEIIDSPHGHDSFLMAVDELSGFVRSFMNEIHRDQD